MTYLQIIQIIIILIFAYIIFTAKICNNEPFFEDIHSEIPPDLIKILISFVEQREQICNIINCTDIVYLENSPNNIGNAGTYEFKRITYQRDGTGLYLWTGYNHQYYDPQTQDKKSFSSDPYVINNLTPVVQISKTGNSKLISASLNDFLRFVGTYSYNDLMNNKVLTIKDQRPNLLLNLLQLKPISYHEFMKRRQYILDRGILN